MRLIIQYFLIFSAFVGIISCEKVDINFGSQYLDPNTQIVRSDTITPTLSTVYIDSFPTGQTGYALIGSYNDPYMGEISSNSFFELGPDIVSSDSVPSSVATFDSLSIILLPDSSFYGDTTKPFGLNVYQLSQNISIQSIFGYLYNTSSFSHYPDALGSGSFIISPSNANDTVKIRLDNSLGMTLFNLLQKKDEKILTDDNFTPFFNGLNITGDGNNQMIMGFKDSVIMRLYYEESGLFNTQKHIDFKLINTNLQFNQIQIDRTGTILGNAGIGPANNLIPASNTSHLSFSQYITGTVSKISFPTIRSVVQAGGFSNILLAQLIIKPVNGSFSTIFPLPPNMQLSATGLGNGFGSPITELINGTAVQQTGNLFIDNLYGQNTNYTYDITSYLNNILSATQDDNLGLLLSAPTPANHTQFNRVILGDNSYAPGQIQLIINYLSVK